MALSFVQRDTWEFECFFSYSDGRRFELENEDKVWFALKKNQNDRPLIYIEQKDLHFKIQSSVTDIQNGIYLYDIGIIFSNGDVRTVIQDSRCQVLPSYRQR